MNIFWKIYYHLTAWIPRKLPRNESEIYYLKYVLREAFTIDDKPQSWITMVGQITSTPPTKVRRPLSDIVNSIRRLTINELAQKEKLRAIEILKAQLEVAVKKEAARQELDTTAAPVSTESTDGAPPIN